MKVLLTASDFGLGYELSPVNQRLAKRLEHNTGSESVLFQSDWDFPGLAQSLGWNIRAAHGRNCQDIRSTDGTVTCKGCGRTASQFIESAREWLDKRTDSTLRPNGIDSYFDLSDRRPDR